MDQPSKLLDNFAWLTLSTNRRGQLRGILSILAQLGLGTVGYFAWVQRIASDLSIVLCGLFVIMEITWLLYRSWDVLPRRKYNAEFDQLHPDLVSSYYLTHVPFDHTTKSETPNCLLTIFPRNQKIVGGICIGLEACAIQIKPNYDDFLRKLYDLQSQLALTIEIGMAQDFASPSNPASSEPSMYYRLFLTRTVNGRASEETIALLLAKLRQMYHELQTVLVTNFPHFRFGLVTDHRLQNAFLGEFGSSTINRTNTKTKPMAEKYTHLMTTGNGVFWLMNVIWFGMMSVIWQLVPLWGVLLGVLGIMGGYLAYHLYRHNHDVLAQGRGFTEISPFATQLLLQSRITKKVYIIDPPSQTVNCPTYFMLGTLNPKFHFIGIKFYRNLLSHFHEDVDRIILQIGLNRVLPWECMPYKDHFKPALQTAFFDSPEDHTTQIRNECGLWEMQMRFGVMIRCELQNPDLSHFSETDYDGFVYRQLDHFRPILQTHFPACDFGVIDLQNPAVLFHGLTKTRSYSVFGDHLPIHFTTGQHLIEFIDVPDEIHKAIPMYYPGEFSIPLVKDPIIFGQTFNPENGHPESPAGLTMEEIRHHVLFAGQDSESLHEHLRLLTYAVFQAEIPMLIFDWDGSFASWYAQTRQTHLGSHLRYFQVGTNLGLKLMELPHLSRGMAHTNYINDVVGAMANCFPLRPADVALMKNVWFSKKENVKPADVTLDKLSTALSSIFGEKNAMQEGQAYLVGLLHLWGQNHLKTALDSELTTYLTPQKLHAGETWLVDLAGLGDMALKAFFIQLFLIQILHLNSLGEAPFVPKVLVSPYLDLLFPDRTSALGSTDKQAWWREVFQNQFAWFGSCDRITALHPTISGQFQSLFVSRIMDPKQFNLVRNLLNLDKVFTNAFSKASRKVSYQEAFMRSLDPSMAIVLRQPIRFPFVFQYNDVAALQLLPTTRKYENFAEIQRRLIPTAPIISASVGKPILESDFSELAPDFDIMVRFLTTVQELLEITSHVTLVQLFERLRDLLASKDRFATQGRLTLEHTARELIQKCVTHQYLLKQTVTLKDVNSDMEAYVLHDKVAKILADYTTHHRMQDTVSPTSPSIDPVSPPPTPEVSSAPEFVALDATDVLAEEDHTLIIPTSANLSLTLMKNDLPKIYVESQYWWDHHQPAESVRILTDGIGALCDSIGKHPAPSQVITRLHAIHDRAMTIATSQTYTDLPSVLDHLKQVYLAIPI